MVDTVLFLEELEQALRCQLPGFFCNELVDGCEWNPAEFADTDVVIPKN